MVIQMFHYSSQKSIARLIGTLRSDLKGTQIFLGCTLIFLGCRHTLIFLGYSLVKDLRGLKIILPTVYKNCYSDASFNEAWIYIRVLTLVSTLTSRPFTCLKVCLLLSACCFATTKLTFILWSEYKADSALQVLFFLKLSLIQQKALQNIPP